MGGIMDEEAIQNLKRFKAQTDLCYKMKVYATENDLAVEELGAILIEIGIIMVKIGLKQEAANEVIVASVGKGAKGFLGTMKFMEGLDGTH
jgi:hypothetical protein